LQLIPIDDVATPNCTIKDVATPNCTIEDVAIPNCIVALSLAMT